MTGEPHVTERGCTLNVLPAPAELGAGVLLYMRMEQESFGRFAEVYLSPADAQWLAGELSPASWGALMAMLNKHWPEDVFPASGALDDAERDPGPVIVGLIRWVNTLLAQLGAESTPKEG